MTELSGLQIFKYLPAAKKAEHTNCKECGCPTCMAFALKLAKHQVELEKCAYLPDELKEICVQNAKQPQKTVEINGVKIGGENVLYRHEKTFINRTAIAVVIDMAKPDWQEKLERVKNFEIKRVNEVLKVDLVLLKPPLSKNLSTSHCHSEHNIQRSFANAQDDRCEESLYNEKLTISLSKGGEPLVAAGINFEDFEKLPLKKIVDKDFSTTSQDLIETRKKAVLEKDENYSDPVYVYFEHTNDLSTLCAKASYYICKYANMLVFEDFDEYLFSALMTLRQNIYTDPQKPLQVESKIYEFNNPDENSLIFLTTNFALTFFAVANELESLPVPSYLVVTPADGMSVLTAWSAEKFTAKVAANTLKKFDFANKVKNRKIIIPGLLAHMKEELEEEIKDFEIVVGTVEAFAIGEFVQNLR